MMQSMDDDAWIFMWEIKGLYVFKVHCNALADVENKWVFKSELKYGDSQTSEL
jgi:hypothetical protein